MMNTRTENYSCWMLAKLFKGIALAITTAPREAKQNCLFSYVLNPPLTSPLFHKEAIFFTCTFFFSFLSISSDGSSKIFLNRVMFAFLDHLICPILGMAILKFGFSARPYNKAK